MSDWDFLQDSLCKLLEDLQDEEHRHIEQHKSQVSIWSTRKHTYLWFPRSLP